MLLCTQGLCAAKQVKPGQGPVAAVWRTGLRFEQHSQQPCRCTWPSIVLPAFARSRPADRAAAHFCHGEIILKSYNLQIKVKAIALAMAADTG